MKSIADKYKAWKEANGNDDDYILDEIHDFIAELSRGELVEVFEDIESISSAQPVEAEPKCNGQDIECCGGEFNDWFCIAVILAIVLFLVL